MRGLVPLPPIHGVLCGGDGRAASLAAVLGDGVLPRHDKYVSAGSGAGCVERQTRDASEPQALAARLEQPAHSEPARVRSQQELFKDRHP